MSVTNHSLMITVKNFYGDPVDVYCDGHTRITIFEEPEAVINDTSTGQVSDGLDRHQITSMMNFQEKVSMLLRAELQRKNISFPLPNGEYHLEVRVESCRKISEFVMQTLRPTDAGSPLINILKSVVDGINAVIICNDNQIVSAGIDYCKKVGTSFNKRIDTLSVELYELRKGARLGVVSFDAETYVIPKALPLHADGEKKYMLFNTDHHKKIGRRLSKIMSPPSSPTYHVHLVFSGNVLLKDVDNLAKSYLQVLHPLGIAVDQITCVSLEKQSNNSPSNVEIIINGSAFNSPKSQVIQGLMKN